MAQPQGTTTLETDLGDETFVFVNEAQVNQAWGSIASQVAQTGEMGAHSSEAGTFTPDAGDGGRAGVGNTSVSDEDFVPVGQEETSTGSGANGYHASYNANLLGDPDTVPPGAVEGEIGPFEPELHGSASATLTPGPGDDILV